MLKPLIWLTLALALPVAAQTAATQANGKDKSIAMIEHDVPIWLEATGIPGMSIALVRNGRTEWLGTFGTADVAAHRSVEVDSAFNVGSLSKPVFAYTVLKLVDEGKLDLDTPLSHYFPERVSEDPRLDRITARFVLSHRTGFPNWRSGKDLPIYFNPGERFSYSGEGMVYLQKTIEHIEGQPLEQIAQRLVFTPLGMTESSYIWKPQWTEHATVGYRPDGSGLPLFHNDSGNAAGSLNTTPRDYAKFVEAVLVGRGLKPATFRAMETPQIALDPTCFICTDKAPAKLATDLFWGLGWGIEITPSGKYIWHWGDNGVYKALVVADVKRKSAIIMMANSEYGLSVAQDIVQDAFGQGAHPAFASLHYDMWKSPNLRFNRALTRGNAADVLQQFNAEIASGTISETALNLGGYALLNAKKYDDAITVLQRNVELHPTSANAYDSLAEAYMNSGQHDLAVKNYEKSLELNPKNDNAKEMLTKLKAPPTPPATP
jgi:CubicO group peptidase (beta-lactamase class C family)